MPFTERWCGVPFKIIIIFITIIIDTYLVPLTATVGGRKKKTLRSAAAVVHWPLTYGTLLA